MCNVCLAYQALAVGSCREDKCYAWRVGFPVEWTPTKPPRVGHAIKHSPVRRQSRLMNNVPRIIRCYIRARGEGAEFKPAEFQLRRPHNKWPKGWIKTDDLAGAISFYGLDLRWASVPNAVKKWLLEDQPLPKLKQPLIAEVDEQ